METEQWPTNGSKDDFLRLGFFAHEAERLAETERIRYQEMLSRYKENLDKLEKEQGPVGNPDLNK